MMLRARIFKGVLFLAALARVQSMKRIANVAAAAWLSIAAASRHRVIERAEVPVVCGIGTLPSRIRAIRSCLGALRLRIRALQGEVGGIPSLVVAYLGETKARAAVSAVAAGVLTLLVSPAMGQCPSPFTSSFNSLAGGDIVGQGGWVAVTPEWGRAQVFPGVGPDGSNAIGASQDGISSAAGRMLPHPFVYTTSHHSVVWSMKAKFEVAAGNNLCIAGVVFDPTSPANDPQVVFGLDFEALTQNMAKPFLRGPGITRLGNALPINHWYEFQLQIDFGAVGGVVGTLRYRDVTLGQAAFTTTAALTNVPLGLTPVGGNYTAWWTFCQFQNQPGGSLMDDLSLDDPCPTPTSTNTISLQAKLDGVAGPTANLSVTFYDAPTGGNPVGLPIPLSDVPVVNGIVSTSVQVDQTTFLAGTSRWMGIRVNGETELAPRIAVTSVPYAIYATHSQYLGNSVYVAPDGNVGIGTLGPQANLDVRGTTNLGNSVFVASSGNVGIGTSSPQANLDVRGTTSTGVLTITGADVAEPFNVSKSDAVPEPIPGMVASIDPANPGKLVVCTTPYDKKVAGAISGAGGLSVGVVLGKENADPLIQGEHPLAMSGRVYVWCDASSDPIEPGDLLTSSSTPGHAMKARDHARAFGAVFGKAMTGLKEGRGLVLVLVNLQ